MILSLLIESFFFNVKYKLPPNILYALVWRGRDSCHFRRKIYRKSLMKRKKIKSPAWTEARFFFDEATKNLSTYEERLTKVFRTQVRHTSPLKRKRRTSPHGLCGTSATAPAHQALKIYDSVNSQVPSVQLTPSAQAAVLILGHP